MFELFCRNRSRIDLLPCPMAVYLGAFGLSILEGHRERNDNGKELITLTSNDNWTREQYAMLSFVLVDYVNLRQILRSICIIFALGTIKPLGVYLVNKRRKDFPLKRLKELLEKTKH